MSANGPTAGEGDRPGQARARPDRLSELDDDQLLAALGTMLRMSQPRPDWSAELAKASYDLRAADAEPC